MHKLCKLNRSPLAHAHQDYGFKDSKGREVGYGWTFQLVAVELLPETAKYGYVYYEGDPMEYIGVRAYPTRDGGHYGASRAEIKCQTVEEATAIVAKLMAQALKRDTKKFVK